MASTIRLTMAQALVRYLAAQHTERDGRRQPFFAGVFGIFGHGNVAGMAQALDQMSDRMRYYQCRNEQAMVHTAAAYAKMHNRLQTFACTTSIGPGATNMVSGAAGATINRLPVLLLPGDIFANRQPAPVLQQLESPQSQEASVNDCFRPVSRYWDRINRPEQLLTALPEAMRVLTSPAETGAVTLALPQDVQAECVRVPDCAVRGADLDRPAGARRRRHAAAGGGGDSRQPRTGHHRRRRRALQRRLRRPADVCRTDRDSGGRNASGQGIHAVGSPAVGRGHRCQRHRRRRLRCAARLTSSSASAPGSPTSRRRRKRRSRTPTSAS